MFVSLRPRRSLTINRAWPAAVVNTTQRNTAQHSTTQQERARTHAVKFERLKPSTHSGPGQRTRPVFAKSEGRLKFTRLESVCIQTAARRCGRLDSSHACTRWHGVRARGSLRGEAMCIRRSNVHSRRSSQRNPSSPAGQRCSRPSDKAGADSRKDRRLGRDRS